MPADVTAESADAVLVAPLRATAEHLLVVLDRAGAELSVSLVDDARMRELNAHYRSKDRTTDVLSFAEGTADAADPIVPDATALLGDVVISVPTAATQAAAGGWSLSEELNRLLVHGLLHLLGYDHEQDAEQARVMRAEERRLVNSLAEASIPCAGLDDEDNPPEDDR